jgi:sec-independent protein translocase protein TatA
MGSLSWWHWALFLVVVLVLFGGKGKVSDVMGDVAKGIKNFKKGLADDTADVADAAKSLEQSATDAAKSAADKVKS